MTRKKWIMPGVDKSDALALSRETGVNSLLAYILIGRGVDTPKKVGGFFDGELGDPFELKDMDKAAERISAAVDSGGKILVFGDYDCDGVTSTAILTSFLATMGANVEARLPSRYGDGYGLGVEAALEAAENGVSLVITVDNGITVFDAADKLKELGIDLIVTDHHQPEDVLPDAVAVVDPWRRDDTSSFKSLCGAGVALKLCAALNDGSYDEILDEYADLAAIGTIADVMPVIGENRIIIKRGVEKIRARDTRPGLETLLDSVLDDRERVTASDIAFFIGPRINAMGRVGSAGPALELLTTEDETACAELVEALGRANDERKKMTRAVADDIDRIIAADPELKNDRIAVIAGEGWPVGILGPAAAGATEKLGKPAVVIGIEETTDADGKTVRIGRGSCRSVDGFSIRDALSAVSGILLTYGGHELAAGVSLRAEDIDTFRSAINGYASRVAPVYQTLSVDMKISSRNLDMRLVDRLSELEPFGKDNPLPTVCVPDVTISRISPMGGGKHIRLDLMGEVPFSAAFFGCSEAEFPYAAGDKVDVCVTVTENTFNPSVSPVTIKLLGLRPAGTDDEKLFAQRAIYDTFVSTGRISPAAAARMCPDRDTVALVYRYIREKGSVPEDAEALTYHLGLPPLRTAVVRTALDALGQLGLIVLDRAGYSAPGTAEKKDLSDSPVIKSLREAADN